jgi:hypothetical protein
MKPYSFKDLVDMRFTHFMKLAVILILLFLASCSNSSSQNATQSLSVSSSSYPITPGSPTKQVD